MGQELPKPFTGGDKQAKDAPSLYFAADEERLYLLLYGGGIASTGIDGTDEKIIVESDAFQFQYVSGWIYYCGDDGIYRITPDGQQKQLLLSKKMVIVEDYEVKDNLTSTIWVDEDDLYYNYTQTPYGGEEGSSALYRLKDNAEKKLVQDFGFYSTDFLVVNDSVYYLNQDGYMTRYDLSTGEKERVFNFTISSIVSFADGVIYYSDEDFNICKYDVSTKKTQTIKQIGWKFSAINFHNYLVIAQVDHDEIAGTTQSRVVFLDTETNKVYEPDTLKYTSSIDICANEENVFIYVEDDANTVYKLRF